jgi:hypothetical protein
VGRILSRVTRARTQSQLQHVSPLPPGPAQGRVAQVYAQVERDFGMLAPPISLHASAAGPLAASWLMLRETLLAEGSVPRATKEAVAVAVSLANSCPYCVDVHSTALHSQVRGGGRIGHGDAVALGDGRTGALSDDDIARIAAWAGGLPPGTPSPLPAADLPELVGTAVTFHYLNRMVNIFLVESPLPPDLSASARRTVRRLVGTVMRPVFRRSVAPGGSLDLLPAAPLPRDLAWAAGRPTVGQAFARAARAIAAAGDRSVPEAVQDLVRSTLACWDGAPPELAGGWPEDRIGDLPEPLRPVARLALLTSLASYRVQATVVDEFRRDRPDDRSLIEVTSWASLAAARWWGNRLALSAPAAGPTGR